MYPYDVTKTLPPKLNTKHSFCTIGAKQWSHTTTSTSHISRVNACETVEASGPVAPHRTAPALKRTEPSRELPEQYPPVSLLANPLAREWAPPAPTRGYINPPPPLSFLFIRRFKKFEAIHQRRKKKGRKKKSTHTLRARRGGSIREEIERDGRLLLDLVGVRSGGERLGLRLAEELPPDLPRRPVPPQARTFRAPFSLLPRVFFFLGIFFCWGGFGSRRGGCCYWSRFCVVWDATMDLGFAWCGMREWI